MCDTIPDCKDEDAEDESDPVCYGVSTIQDYGLNVYLVYISLGGFAYCCK